MTIKPSGTQNVLNLVVWSENCIQVYQRNNMLICHSQRNPLQHTLLRFSSKFDSNTNEMEFKATFLGSINLPNKRTIKQAFCQYTMGKRDDSHCRGLILILNDISSVYVKIPSVGMVKHVIPKNGALDLSEVERLSQDKQYILNIEYLIQNDLIFAIESLYFQKIQSKHIDQWKDYDQERTTEGLLGTWKKRLQINLQSVKDYGNFVWKKIQKREWGQIFNSDSKHNDFLGFDQKMIIMTQQFNLHLMNWDGLKVEKSVDILDLLEIYVSPDYKAFWGSGKKEVMTWIPINLYLSNEFDENKILADDHIAQFDDSSRETYEQYGPKILTKSINDENKMIYGCNMVKLDNSVESESFYVLCMLKNHNSPYIIFKMNANTLTLEYMTVKQLRQAARKLDDLISSSFLRNFGVKPGNSLKLYKDGEEPKLDSLINWVRFDNNNGMIYGITHESNRAWTINLTEKRKFIQIIRSDNKTGESSQVNQVLGNLVLQKVNDANIVLVLYYEKPEDTPENDPKRQINLMLVDIKTGKIFKTISLVVVDDQNINLLKNSLRVFIVDHTFYILFKTSLTSKYYVFSISVFRRAIQQDIVKIIKDYFKGVTGLDKLDHLGEESEIVVLDRKYLLPNDSQILGFSKTKNNVTQKSLFINSNRNQIWGIPQIMLSPQRMTQKQIDEKAKHVENGTLHYTKRDMELQYMMENYPVYSQPEIILHPGLSVSKDVSLLSTKFFSSEGTFLESTSLVLAGGLDWFAFRYSPDGLYDRVNPDFKKNLLILGVCAISLLLLASKFYENVGIAKKRYLSSEK